MEQRYQDNPQVNTGIYDLVNAIILRAVQDTQLTSLSLNSSQVSKEGIRERAINFINGENFEYMCECVNKDWKAIRDFINRN